jgi:phage-related minor tail protein
MAKFANINLELNKITQLADVQVLKAELNRLASEIRKRGESEVAHIEKSVKQARAKAQKLQKKIEVEKKKIEKQVKQEIAKIRRQLGGKKTATRGKSKSASAPKSGPKAGAKRKTSARKTVKRA